MRADVCRAARGLLRPWWVGLFYGIVAALPLAAWAAGCPAEWLASVVGWANGYGILIVCSAVLVRLEEPRARLIPRYRHVQWPPAGCSYWHRWSSAAGLCAWARIPG